MNTELDQLINDLKGATAPSRELDKRIAITVGWKIVNDKAGGNWQHPEGYFVTPSAIPQFTLDINAATTLVPEEHRNWGLYNVGYVDGIYQNGKAVCDIQHDLSSGGIFWIGVGATPAIAVCIAAFKSIGNYPTREI